MIVWSVDRKMPAENEPTAEEAMLLTVAAAPVMLLPSQATVGPVIEPVRSAAFGVYVRKPKSPFEPIWLVRFVVPAP